MTAIEFLTHPLAQRLTWTLAHFVWQGFLIAIILAALVEVLRVRSANARYALSLAAFGLMLAMVPTTWVMLGEKTVSSVAIQQSMAARVEFISAEVVLSEPSSAWWTTLQPQLLLAWCIGCVLLNIRLIVGWLALHTLLRSRLPLSRAVTIRLSRLGSRFQVSIPNVVFASQQVSQALAVGFFRPVVLLPAAWLLELPPNLLEAVVAHELAHLRRCDLWVNLLQRLAEALLFYHPAVWWLSARLRRERELCCDQLAVAATGDRLEYAQALELTARWATVDGRPALATGFLGEGKMNLLHRVRCVLGISSERPASLWPASLLLGGLSLALLAAIYAANSSAVNADDERPAPKPAASEADRFLSRVQEAPKREGDRLREGEVRRDGDRPREAAAPRDGERKPEVRRPDQPRPDQPRPDGEARRPAAGGEQAELMTLIRQLRAEVAELRQEVARLRGDRGEAVRRPAAEADRPRPEGERREGADRPKAEAERPKPAPERREGGDKPKAEGDRR